MTYSPESAANKSVVVKENWCPLSSENITMNACSNDIEIKEQTLLIDIYNFQAYI